MRILTWFTIFSLSVTLLLNQPRETNAQSDCKSLETCKACIRTRDCVWCNNWINKETISSATRCVSAKYAKEQGNDWCPRDKIVNQTTVEKIIKNVALSSVPGKTVQIKPQKVKLELRQGVEHHLKVQYRQAIDYPVDLYFLVDLTYSMRNLRRHLSTLGNRIVDAMQKLTKNVRLGLGSFVDKKLRPMTRQNEYYPHHVSFNNCLPLVEDWTEFQYILHNAPLSGNKDEIEGGLEAMMQVIVCTEQIKWRSDARHLLVYVSDIGPHIAGDGKLAGVPQPNDEKCHLDSNGIYTHAKEQDYPSLGQINWQAKKNNINIIFGTLEAYKEIHDAISSRVTGSSVGIFDAKSDTVIQLISDQYKELVKTLTMTSNASSNYVDVKFRAKCPNGNGKFSERNKCDGIRVDQTVDFDIVIKAIACPEEEKDWHQIIEIKPEGINERVIVELDLICGCECSKGIKKDSHSRGVRECNNNGIIDCGICSCNRGYFGKTCQCEGEDDFSNTNSSLATCRSENSLDICSGHGRCVCGSCSCDLGPNSEKLYYGKFCQCEDLSCKRSPDGKLCGGHGNCVCGKCVCHSGWGGTNCECKDDVSRCIPPNGNGKVCNGVGKCVCGTCVCDKKMGREGRFCEDCASCPSQRCDEFKDCVECVVHKSGKIYQQDRECGQCLEKVTLREIDDIKEDPENFKTTGEHFCRIAGDDGSTFVFTYAYGNGDDASGKSTIVAKREKDYPVIADWIAASAGVIFLTLILGLLILLIWKICTHLHDKREFEKFIEESEKSKWGQQQNPLYSNPVTTIQNPTFDELLQQEEY